MFSDIRNHSTLFSTLIRWFLRYKIASLYFILFLVIFSILISNVFKFGLLPIIFLIAYDYIFIKVIYPNFIKKIIYNNVNIVYRRTDLIFLFQFNEEMEENTIILTFPTTILPIYINNSYFNTLIRKVSNYIWLCKFYQQHARVKYYLLPYLVIAVHTIFFIFMYIFYYNYCNCLYLFIFLLAWLFYSIYNIEDILNLKKYNSYFEMFKKNIYYRQYFRHMNIVEVKNQTLVGVQPSYFKEIESAYNKEYKQKMDYIIGFMSTVVFIALLTFIVSRPNLECKTKGVVGESNVSHINKTTNRKK